MIVLYLGEMMILSYRENRAQYSSYILFILPNMVVILSLKYSLLVRLKDMILSTNTLQLLTSLPFTATQSRRT